MTLDEVREVLATVIWYRDTPLITLFEDLVKHCDTIPEKSVTMRGRVTSAFAQLTHPTASSGQIVALVLGMRRDAGMNIYNVGLQEKINK